MPDVPGRYFCSLAGVPYAVDHKGGQMGRRSIPLQRPFQDVSSKVGEHSLTTDDLWRRSFESWHRGAGQSSFDRPDGDEFRFDSSLGVDPWTKWRLGLLGDTDRKLASTNTTCKLAVAGGYLYAIDGQTLKFTSSVTAAGVASWTTVTGTPAVAAQSVTSDGFRVWVAYGASGIYATSRGAASASMYTDVPATLVEYAKGRLMVASGTAMYNITSTARVGGAAFRGVTTDSSSSAVTLKTMSYPAGAQPGDLLLLYVMGTPSGAVTPSGGFDPVSFNGNVFSGSPQYAFEIHSGVMPSDGSSTFTVSTHSGSAEQFLLVCVAYASVDTTVLYESEATDASSTGQHPASADGTFADTEGPLLYLFATYAKAASVTSTPPTFPFGGTMTERADLQISNLSLAVNDDIVMGASSDSPVITGNLSASVTSGVHASVWRSADIPTALFSHPSGDFTWVGFAEGQGDIYAAGYSGDKSLIYKTQIRDDATSLDQPSVAGALPDGEIVRSIYGYLGYIFIGTDLGVRMAQSDANGNLTIGSLIPTPAPVRCFEGQDRFVWYGLEQFDVSAWASGTYDGLGRLDLREQPDPVTPAYASDLMVTTSTGTTEQVQSIATFQNLRVLSIADSGGASRGVYAETATKVAAGYLDSGLVTYGISDVKVATYLDVRHRPLAGTVQAYVAADEAAFVSVGTSSAAGSTTPAAMVVGSVRGETHEVRVKLSRSGSSDTVGPQLTRLTLRSEPAPTRGRILIVPLMLEDHIVVAGQQIGRNPGADLAAIEALFASQTLVTYLEGSASYSVFIKDYEFVASKVSENAKANVGVCTVQLKVPGA